MPITKHRAAFRPFEYPWAFEAFKAQVHAQWTPTEVPMGTDILDYSDLPEPERNLLVQVLRFFTQGDMEVSNNYQTRLMPKFPVTEVQMMLGQFAAMEGVHVYAYSYLIDSLGLPESEYEAFLEYASMRNKYEYLHGFQADSPFHLALTLGVFGAFMEGTALFASFAILMNFPRQGKMMGLGQIISWSIRDESLHADNICRLYRTYVAEDPYLADNQKLKQDLRKACVTMVEMEDAFIDTCFEMGAVRGLEAQDVKNYVRWIADTRLGDLGLDPEFHIKDNPLPWLEMMLTSEAHVNFFEQKPTEYAKGIVDDDWPE